jgi:hypothetical protein
VAIASHRVLRDAAPLASCVRATKDLDVWVRPDAGNADRVLSALAAFGAPIDDVTTADFSQAGITFKSASIP